MDRAYSSQSSRDDQAREFQWRCSHNITLRPYPGITCSLCDPRVAEGRPAVEKLRLECIEKQRMADESMAGYIAALNDKDIR